MLSTVLNSERAILVNIEIMRAFVKLRQLLASNVELSRRFDELESKYDKQFRVVFKAIRELMRTPPGNRKEIGFSVALSKEVRFIRLCARAQTTSLRRHRRGVFGVLSNPPKRTVKSYSS